MAIGCAGRLAVAAAEPTPRVEQFPADGAVDVNPDTPLIITFDTPIALGSGGKIQVRDLADDSIAETIDVSIPVATKEIGGLPNFHYHPIIIEGRRAVLSLPNHALRYGHVYTIACADGVFVRAGGGDARLAAPGTWKFSTRKSPPATSSRIVVSSAGGGDYSSVQGALDSIADGNRSPVTIFVRRGIYREIVFFTNKHNLTLVGEDREETVIAYANNARLNADSGGNPFAPHAPQPSEASAKQGGSIYRRGLFLAHRVDDITIEHLTLRNTTAPGGSQAEAIILNGTTTARAVLKDVDLYSYQDTLQINGQAYIKGCRIEGDVDFMWGTGPCYFESCTLRSLRSNAYYTQIRNPPTNHGFVYHRCWFTGLPGVMGNYLSRIDPARFPTSEVVLLDCTLGPAVGEVGWQLQNKPGPKDAGEGRFHFWEFNSHGETDGPVASTFRLPGSQRLNPGRDAALISNYGDPKFVLGGWDPLTVPISRDTPSKVELPGRGVVVPATRKVSVQMVLLGTAATFVADDNAGDGKYVWKKDGEIVPGAQGKELLLQPVGWNDAGVYSVSAAGSGTLPVISSARLTVVGPAAARPPQLPGGKGKVFSVLENGAKGDGMTDNAAAIQRTIAAAAAAGGGRVEIPAAARPFLSGPLELASGVELHLSAGATLQALPYAPAPGSGLKAYPTGGARYPDFITASGLHDVALSGDGTIDGDGAPWWTAFEKNPRMPHRPYLIRFNHCDRVLVSGLTFKNSPMFHLALSAVDNLTVFGIVIATPAGPNTDGVDPSGSHQLFQNCRIATGDDNIVLKPGGAFCSDITIADCYFGAGHGLSVGGQTNLGLEGMTVKNCYFDGTTSGLRLKADATEGGVVKNIAYSDLVMHQVQYPIVFYSYYNKIGSPGAVGGKNETTEEKVRRWNESPPNSLASKTLPAWRDITVSNLWATGTTGYSTIWGLDLPGYQVENVRINNAHFADGPGFEIYNAANVQFSADCVVPSFRVYNSPGFVPPGAASSRLR